MRLSVEQEATAAAVEEEWLDAALLTGAADRDSAEAGVAAAYRAAGLAPPRRVVWLGSPFAGAVAAAVVANPANAARIADQPDAVGGGDGPRLAALARNAVHEVHRQGWRPGDAPGRPGRPRVRTRLWSDARAAALDGFGADGWAQLSAAAGRRGWHLIMDLVAGRLRSRLGDDLMMAGGAAGWASAARTCLLDAVYGQHDAAWLATFTAGDRLRPQAGMVAGLHGLAAVARSAGWWWPFADLVILTERPVVLERDNVGRLHRGEGAALGYPDGYGLHAWRGMPIPAELVDELPRLTVERIRVEANAEVRRVMLEHFGYERYLREAGATRRGEDEAGVLWQVWLPNDEPLVMVEVVNSTPEPDGTHRRYWLRVPPTTRTPREGVAWTFGLTAEEYAPLVQT
ncbi:DUF6745 domain-containing protein [Planosporangium sp. 12N6]|uniref:DUF6745 domain-containing protein n=1 Tax=Planosporangium spinosum TaxID=3402278 RepID=UPI003CEAEB85